MIPELGRTFDRVLRLLLGISTSDICGSSSSNLACSDEHGDRSTGAKAYCPLLHPTPAVVAAAVLCKHCRSGVLVSRWQRRRVKYLRSRRGAVEASQVSTSLQGSSRLNSNCTRRKCSRFCLHAREIKSSPKRYYGGNRSVNVRNVVTRPRASSFM